MPLIVTSFKTVNVERNYSNFEKYVPTSISL
jgi:hypothetical protein